MDHLIIQAAAIAKAKQCLARGILGQNNKPGSVGQQRDWKGKLKSLGEYSTWYAENFVEIFLQNNTYCFLDPLICFHSTFLLNTHFPQCKTAMQNVISTNDGPYVIS